MARKQSADYVAADQLAGALQAMVGQLNGRGINVMGATLLPRTDAWRYERYQEATRQEVNAWIRSYAGFDQMKGFV